MTRSKPKNQNLSQGVDRTPPLNDRRQDDHQSRAPGQGLVAIRQELEKRIHREQQRKPAAGPEEREPAVEPEQDETRQKRAEHKERMPDRLCVNGKHIRGHGPGKVVEIRKGRPCMHLRQRHGREDRPFVRTDRPRDAANGSDRARIGDITVPHAERGAVQLKRHGKGKDGQQCGKTTFFKLVVHAMPNSRLIAANAASAACG